MHAPGRLMLGAAVLLTLVASLGLYRSGSLAFLFVPAALVAIPVLALRLLERPVLVFAAFVVVAVNLDFIRFGDTAVTMDVLVSSLLLWALTVRLGLFEAFDFRNPVVRVMLLFLAATIISVVLSVNPVSSLKNWVRDIQYLVFFVFLITLPIRAADHRLLIGAIVASSVVPCLLGLLGVAFGLEVFYGQHTPLGGGELVQRIQSTLSHPVTFSHYLAMVSLLTLSLILAGDGWPRRYLVPVFMLQMVNLYGTYGRTGWGSSLSASWCCCGLPIGGRSCCWGFRSWPPPFSMPCPRSWPAGPRLPRVMTTACYGAWASGHMPSPWCLRSRSLVQGRTHSSSTWRMTPGLPRTRPGWEFWLRRVRSGW